MAIIKRYAVKRIKNLHGFGPYWLWQARIVDKTVHIFEFSTKAEAEKYVEWYKREVAA